MKLTEGIITTDTSEGTHITEVIPIEEETDQGLLLEVHLGDLDMTDTNVSIEAETHLGGETHLGEDQAQERERNLGVKIVNGHARQTGFLSIPGASGANARLASKSGRSLWILWQRKQRLG